MPREFTPEERKKIVGASECAQALGYSKWGTPAELWASKTTTVELPPRNNSAMWLGKMMEPSILEAYQEETGIDCLKPDPIISQEYPHLGCSPDGISKDGKRGVELKFINNWDSAKEWTDDSVPIQYLMQCHHSMIVTKITTWDLYAVVAGKGTVRHTFTADSNLHKEIIEGLRNFWQYVQSNVMPPSSCSASIRWRIDNGGSIQVGNMMPLVQQLRQVREQMKQLEVQKESLEEQIKMGMGANANLLDGSETMATWRSNEVHRLDTEAFKAAYPDLYKQFCRPTSQRRFLLKG